MSAFSQQSIAESETIPETDTAVVVIGKQASVNIQKPGATSKKLMFTTISSNTLPDPSGSDFDSIAMAVLDKFAPMHAEVVKPKKEVHAKYQYPGATSHKGMCHTPKKYRDEHTSPDPATLTPNMDVVVSAITTDIGVGRFQIKFFIRFSVLSSNTYLSADSQVRKTDNFYHNAPSPW